MHTAIVHKYGDHVDTDTIIPGKYLTLRTPEELGPHCLEGLDPGFVERVKAGDIIVAGKNFGSGSSREHAPIAIKATGVSCVVAESFARIFYRNAINIGLPVFECAALVAAVNGGDKLALDIEGGVFTVNNARFEAGSVSNYIQAIVKAGGLVPFVQQQIDLQKEPR